MPSPLFVTAPTDPTCGDSLSVTVSSVTGPSCSTVTVTVPVPGVSALKTLGATVIVTVIETKVILNVASPALISAAVTVCVFSMTLSSVSVAIIGISSPAFITTLPKEI